MQEQTAWQPRWPRASGLTLSSVDAFADGVAVKTIGAETFRLCQQLVDGVVLVDNAAVSGAVQDVFEETRCILEPAGALAVAGARAYLKHHKLKVCPLTRSACQVPHPDPDHWSSGSLIRDRCQKSSPFLLHVLMPSSVCRELKSLCTPRFARHHATSRRQPQVSS